MAWQEETRRTEIRYMRHGIWIGALTVGVGFVTAIAAVFAALAAARAVSTAQDAVLRASREQRLGNGVESMGGETSAQRIAGIGLLVRSVTNEMNRVVEAKGRGDDHQWDRDRRDVNASYIATLDALENYIASWTTPSGDGASAHDLQPPTPNVDYVLPKDVQYAANAVKSLTGDRAQKAAKVLDLDAAMDLSYAPLSGLNLSTLDVAWLGTVYAKGVDLRNATLTKTKLGAATKLIGGHLQCADFAGADLRGTNLQDADLRGANFADADLEGATILGAKLRGAVLTQDQLDEAKGSKHVGGDDALSDARDPLCMQHYGALPSP